MKNVFISLCFAVLFTVLSWLFRKTGKDKRDCKKAIARITGLSDHNGRVNYYVALEENGQALRGKSISYPSSGKSYEVGKLVPVSYYLTKNEWVRVTIQDEELSPSKNSAKFLSKVLLIIAILFYMAAIIFSCNSASI